MQRAKIKAGITYAIKPGSDYGSPSPVMFLEDGTAGIYSRRDRGTGIDQHEETKYTKARAGRGWGEKAVGYAAIMQDWMSPGTDPLPPPWVIDPAAELERFRAGQGPSVAGLRFDIITGLAKIVPWDEAVAENEAREAARREAQAKSEAVSARRQAAVERFRALGVNPRQRTLSSDIELPVAEAEKLLAMLEAGR